MVINKENYPLEEVEAAKSVLIELVHLLGDYKNAIVLVGGWVPIFLIPDPEQPHIGSTDVDLALDHREIDEPGYKSILELLEERGYQKSQEQPFIFYRIVTDNNIRVQVDFLAGEYEGSTRSHRTQRVQDLQPRKARGCDLAFLQNVEVTIEGQLPSGAFDKVDLKVAAAPAFIAMKGFAIKSRLKEKDSWDVYYCISNYPGGFEALTLEFAHLIDNGLIQEGLQNIAEAFSSIDSIGPISVADFEGLSRGDDRDLLLRDAYERVNVFLEILEIIK